MIGIRSALNRKRTDNICQVIFVTMEINETNENRIGLKSVVKTPYELYINELLEEGADSDCVAVTLDVNGNILPNNESGNGLNNFWILWF